MSRAYSELALSIGSKSAGVLSAAGIQLILAWLLQAEGRGAYAVCTLFSNVLAMTFLFGIDLAGIFFISSKRFTFSQGILTTSISCAFGAILAVISGLLLMQLPLPFFEKADQPELYLSLLSIPFFMFSLVFIEVFSSIRMFGWYSIMALVRCLSLFVFTVVYLTVFKGGVPGSILAIICTDIVVVTGSLVVFIKKCGLTWAPVRLRDVKDMLNYGLRYWIGVFSNQMNFRIGTLVIAFFASRSEIGIYAFALSITMQMQVLPDAMRSVLVPRTAQQGANSHDLVTRCARLTAAASFFMLVGFLLFAQPVVDVFLPPTFLSSVPLIRILAFSFFLRTLGKSLEPYLIGCNRPGIISLSVVAGLIVNVVSLIFLVPLWGVTGAAWSVVLNYLVSSSILVYGFDALAKAGLSSIFMPRKSDLSFLSTLQSRFVATRVARD